jgi:hypothetical protein
MKQGLLLAAILVPLLLATVAVSVWAWGEIGDTEMDVQGYIALGLGIAATVVIGGGLMGLVFYSSRHGYDERVGRSDDED